MVHIASPQPGSECAHELERHLTSYCSSVCEGSGTYVRAHFSSEESLSPMEDFYAC